MKNSTIIGITLIFTLLISCSTTIKVRSRPILIDELTEYSKVIPDSTLEPGYDPFQRAFAYYLRSLPKEEKQKWVNGGSFSEQEKDRFLNKIDSIKKDNDSLR